MNKNRMIGVLLISLLLSSTLGCISKEKDGHVDVYYGVVHGISLPKDATNIKVVSDEPIDVYIVGNRVGYEQIVKGKTCNHYPYYSASGVLFYDKDVSGLTDDSWLVFNVPEPIRGDLYGRILGKPANVDYVIKYNVL